MVSKPNRWLPGWLLLLMLAATTAQAEMRLAEAPEVGVIQQTDLGPLSLPSDVAVAPDGRIWVVDSGRHRLAVFTPHGDFLFAAGGRGEGEGSLQDPLGLTIDEAGSVYVADAGNRRIEVFDAEGAWQRSIAARDGESSFRPADVALSGDGEALFVSANDRHRIYKLAQDGRVLTHWGGEGLSQGQFRYPATLAARDGLLYVVDVLNTRVQVFNESGEFHFQIGEWGVRPGQLFRPKGVALDSRGWIYVSDSYMDLVEVFDSSYSFRHVLGEAGRPLKFIAPTGMAVDGFDRLYVCEMLANRVSIRELP